MKRFAAKPMKKTRGFESVLTRSAWQPYLEVWREGVWEPHVPRKGTEDEVSHLDAVRRDDVTETEVVIT